jgi:acyl-CoA synthetase (AMP-forming)/AMP-acid ligase II
MADHDVAAAAVRPPLSQRITDVLDLQPAAPALEFDGQWLSWGQIGAMARTIGSLAATHAGSQQPLAGLLVRNRPAHVAALLGILLSGGCVVVINPSRGDERTRADVSALQLPVIIGEPDDVAALVPASAGTTVVSISSLAEQPQVTAAAVRSTGFNARPGVAVWMLTSGTTGPPKRVDLTYDMLAHSVMGPDYDRSPAPTALRRGVAIVNSPLVHIGGVFRVLQCVTEARPFVLLERFELNRWAEAVHRHRPHAVSLVPTALRMVLHSDLRREDLESIRAVTSGTAPLSAEDADAFTEKYGIPVLTSYAATEFGGGVAGWTLADHQKYWHAKRGSVGRANPGAQLRVVGDDGTPLGADQEGVLEVKPGQLGPSADWIRTTDTARIDADGFLWILGRADQAIIRGGFKVMPDDVRTALESHPAVAGAAVVGLRDERLGETPVAMVELRQGGSVDADGLVDHLRTQLARYEIPTKTAIVDAIPRTPSGKPDLSAIRRFFSETVSAAPGDHAE